MKLQELQKMFQEFPIRATNNHQYIHLERPKIDLVSLSKVLDYFEHEFNAEEISYYIAKGRSMTGLDNEIKKIQQGLLFEWEQKRNTSLERGNMIHRNIENQFRHGSTLDPEWQKFCSRLYNETMGSGENVVVKMEQELWDEDYNICGTTDKLVIPSSRAKVLKGNYSDTKTNEKINTTGDKYLKPPLDFLIQCEYTRYCLQLSGYAYMGEKSFGIKPGTLYIEFVRGPYDEIEKIPMPYMKYEVELMFKAYRQRVIVSNDDQNW